MPVFQPDIVVQPEPIEDAGEDGDGGGVPGWAVGLIVTIIGLVVLGILYLLLVTRFVKQRNDMRKAHQSLHGMYQTDARKEIHNVYANDTHGDIVPHHGGGGYEGPGGRGQPWCIKDETSQTHDGRSRRSRRHEALTYGDVHERGEPGEEGHERTLCIEDGSNRRRGSRSHHGGGQESGGPGEAMYNEDQDTVMYIEDESRSRRSRRPDAATCSGSHRKGRSGGANRTTSSRHRERTLGDEDEASRGRESRSRRSNKAEEASLFLCAPQDSRYGDDGFTVRTRSTKRSKRSRRDPSIYMAGRDAPDPDADALTTQGNRSLARTHQSSQKPKRDPSVYSNGMHEASAGSTSRQRREPSTYGSSRRDPSMYADSRKDPLAYTSAYSVNPYTESDFNMSSEYGEFGFRSEGNAGFQTQEAANAVGRPQKSNKTFYM